MKSSRNVYVFSSWTVLEWRSLEIMLLLLLWPKNHLMILCCKCLVVSHFVCSAKTNLSRGWNYSLKTILIALRYIASFSASATSDFFTPSFVTATEPEKPRYLRGRHVSSNFFVYLLFCSTACLECTQLCQNIFSLVDVR